MVVLVTGASGFLGRHLVSFLAARGHIVHAVMRYQLENTTELFGAGANIAVHEYTGTLDSVVSITKSANPDVAIHLATHYVAEHQPAELDKLVDANIRFGVQLLESMIQSSCRRVLVTGTNWQRKTEDGSYNPLNLYTATKEAFERLLEFYVQRYWISADIAYLFETYAPDDNRGKLLSALVDAASSGKVMKLSPGEQRINLVHVRDVCEALSLLIEYEFAEQGTTTRYSIHSDDTISLRQLVEKLEEVTGKSIRVDWGAVPYREGTVFLPWTNGKRPKNWEPQVPLADGLHAMWEKRAGRSEGRK